MSDEDPPTTTALARIEAPVMRARLVRAPGQQRRELLNDLLRSGGGGDVLDPFMGILGRTLSTMADSMADSMAPREDPLRPAIRRELELLLKQTGRDPIGSPAATVKDAIVQISMGVEQLAAALQRTEPSLAMQLAIVMAAVELDPANAPVVEHHDDDEGD